MQTSPVLSLSPSSPSFNSYSSSNIAEIAARVVEEFRQESNDLDSDMFSWEPPTDEIKQEEEEEEEEEEEDEFEFAVVYNKKPDSPVSADEIFFNGQIKPIYPLFDRNLLLNYETAHSVSESKGGPRIRSPLGKLMSEERETDVSLSCSSSEADDLDNLQPGTYCVWTPKASKESPAAGRCKKSNSTGSSKRWNKFRDLLYRSNSDGKDTFVFLTPPSHNNNKKASAEEENKKGSKNVEDHYVRNRNMKEEDKKRSYLPYRQDLVGFFNNVNGLSKNLHPF